MNRRPNPPVLKAQARTSLSSARGWSVDRKLNLSTSKSDTYYCSHDNTSTCLLSSSRTPQTDSIISQATTTAVATGNEWNPRTRMSFDKTVKNACKPKKDVPKAKVRFVHPALHLPDYLPVSVVFWLFNMLILILILLLLSLLFCFIVSYCPPRRHPRRGPLLHSPHTTLFYALHGGNST